MTRTFKDATAVITGAGSGMGRSMAINLARRGARLAISDWDEIGLEKTAAMVAEAGATELLTTRLDVRDKDAFTAHAIEVANTLGPAGLMVNNAGVALFSNARDQKREDAEWIMDVDFWGVVNGTEAFLPQLGDAGRATGTPGRLVNISSLFGLISCPTQSAYNAAKFAVRGYSEALSMELRLAKDPITVTVVHPGGIKTGIARAARYAPGTDVAKLTSFFDEQLARMTADKAADIILKGASRGKSRVVVGLDAQVAHLTQQIVGASYQRLVTTLAGQVLRRQAPDMVTTATDDPRGEVSEAAR